MRRGTSILLSGGAVVALAVGLLAAGALGGSPHKQGDATQVAGRTASSVDPLVQQIEAAQATLKANPDDFRTWAKLGLAYVQQAKVTVDPTYYAKAEGAVRRSLSLNRTDNFEGYAAQAALESGRHDFGAALASAKKGIAINGSNSLLYGALGDAYTQLGRYDRAAAAIDRMNQLLPGVPAFTRASYVLELRGDIKGARAALQRALQDSSTSGDRAFSNYYLGELALNYGGDARTALSYYRAGLLAAPRDPALLAGKARVEAALGQTRQAVTDYQAVVAAVPQPQYVLELGELQESLGDRTAAARQYALFRTEERLFRANGVALDVEPTLFEADHGSPVRALTYAAAGWKLRPFLEMADAYAWALYRNQRYAEAKRWSQRALATRWPNALFHFHRGMIEKSLGDRTGATADLRLALDLNPHFNVLHAATARRTLATLR